MLCKTVLDNNGNMRTSKVSLNNLQIETFYAYIIIDVTLIVMDDFHFAVVVYFFVLFCFVLLFIFILFSTRN